MSTQACPSCGKTIPVETGYITWCGHCSWNIVAPPAVQPRTRFDRAYAAAGRRLAERLSAELLRAETLEPKLTPSRLTAYAIAGAIDLVALAFVAAGLFVAVTAFPLGVILGLLIASPAVLMVPRLGKLDKDAPAVARDEAPELYALIDRVASAVGTKTATVLVVDSDYNASWAVVGWRRRRVLTLGLPLLTALDPDERVALVAHELAHSKNGDSSRGFVVGGAIGALVELYILVRPERDPVGADVLINWFFAILARPVWWLIQLEFHLLRRDSQRAEYLADALAAQVAGSSAVVRLHEKFLLEPTVRAVIQHAVRGGDDDLFVTMQQSLRAVPERERERRRRVARLEESRLADSHPPTARRIELLEGRAPAEAMVDLSVESSEAIDRELAPRRVVVAQELLDEYRARVYNR